MRRRLLNLLTALSLLLCVAVCVLWVRSGRVHDIMYWGVLRRDDPARPSVSWFRVRSFPGVVRLDWQRNIYAGRHPERFDPGGPTRLRWVTSPRRPLPPTRDPAVRRQLGFLSERNHDDGKGLERDSQILDELAVEIPYWGIALAAAPLPVARLIRRLGVRNRRRNAGLCPLCGYDLRATPGRCPECGRSNATTPA